MNDYDRIRSFYEQHRPEPDTEPDTASDPSPRHVAAAEHLGRVLKIEAGQRVLSVSTESAHWSRFFAERGAHVTVLEQVAQRSGTQIEQRTGTIADPPLSAAERFDIMHLGDVLVRLEDAELPQVRAVARAHCKAGALLLLRESVDPRGPSRLPARDRDAIFRRPEQYRALFAPDFRLLYERPAVSSLALGKLDYFALQLEERLRASRLQALLGEHGVSQRFYIFVRKPFR